MQITRNNYEEHLIAYMEGEVTPEQARQVQEFLSRHTDLQQELELLQECCVRPDEQVAFPDKSRLMKKEESRVIGIIGKRWLAVAAAVLVAAVSLVVVLQQQPAPDHGQVAVQWPHPEEQMDQQPMPAQPDESASEPELVAEREQPQPEEALPAQVEATHAEELVAQADEPAILRPEPMEQLALRTPVIVQPQPELDVPVQMVAYRLPPYQLQLIQPEEAQSALMAFAEAVFTRVTGREELPVKLGERQEYNLQVQVAQVEVSYQFSLPLKTEK